MVKQIILITAMLTLLSGCGTEHRFGSYEVREHMLTDGTQCATLIGFRKGGLSCNWSNRDD